MKKEKEFTYIMINNGFIYFNNTKGMDQWYSVFYPKQDCWYIYGPGYDVKTLTNKDMFRFLFIIDSCKTTLKIVLELLLEVGNIGYTRCKLYNNKVLLGSYYPQLLQLDNMIEFNYSFDDFIKEEGLSYSESGVKC